VPKRPVLVNGTAGVLVALGGQVVGVMGFTVSGGKITEIDVIVGAERFSQLDLAALA
jgi:RNA polymerase sigma-70 factor, ECF subfamily